jgi:hypothetical protein
LHPGQKLFCRFSRDAASLEGQNFSPLPPDLAAHAFNFCSDSDKLHGSDLTGLIRTKREQIGKPLGLVLAQRNTPKKRLKSGYSEKGRLQKDR